MRALGRAVLSLLGWTGAVALLAGRCGARLGGSSLSELVRALVHFGARSLGLATGAGALIGATVVLQAGVYADEFGARLYTGWAAGYALLWEFGPLLLGLLMAARIGARNAAELALLTLHGQIEGLRGISLDPYRILIAPRVIASVVSVVALSQATFLVAVAFEALAAMAMLGIPLRVFLGSFADMLHVGDVVAGAAKSLAFGLTIALVSTTAGLRVEGGARGVGRAAASAVLVSCASIFGLDFMLTPLLARALE